MERRQWLHFGFSYYYGVHARYLSSWLLSAVTLYCLWNNVHAPCQVKCYILSAFTFTSMGIPYSRGPYVGLLLAVTFPAFMPCPICPSEFSPEECVQFQRANGCHACDERGCWQGNPACEFYGRSRASHPDAEIGDSVPHMCETRITCTADGFEMTGRLCVNWWQQYQCVRFTVNESEQFFMGRASGEECNCLIDTLRQQLNLECDVKAVRAYVQERHVDVVAGDLKGVITHVHDIAIGQGN